MVLPWNGRPSDELSSHFTRSGTGFLVNAVVERTMRVVAPIVAGGLLLAVWFLLVDVARVLPPSVPSPNAIIAQFGENFGIIVNATRITASNAALGLLIGAVLSDAWKGKAKSILDAAAEEGVMVLQASPDVVRFAPSLVIEEVDINEGLDCFERAVARLVQA